MVKLGTMKWLAAALVVFAAASLAYCCGNWGGARLSAHGGSMSERVAALGLPAETEAAVLQILETHRQAAENWRTENQAALAALKEQFQAAREAGDAEALQALGEEFRQLMQGGLQLREALMAELSEVLSEEQLAQLHPRRGGRGHGWRGHRGMGHAPRFIAELGLTEEQIEQAKAIFAEAREQAASAETGQAKMEIFRAAMQRVHDEVLTAEQQVRVDEAMERFSSLGLPEELQFTEQQREQMQALCQEVRASLGEDATPEERRAALHAGFQRFREEVLTEEQRAAFRELLGQFHHGCHGHRHGARLGRGGCGRQEPQEQPQQQEDPDQQLLE